MWYNQPTDRPTDQPNNQPVNQPTNQPINQATNYALFIFLHFLLSLVSSTSPVRIVRTSGAVVLQRMASSDSVLFL
jgi:hypothetical protein